jgi:hypothetical protein
MDWSKRSQNAYGRRWPGQRRREGKKYIICTAQQARLQENWPRARFRFTHICTSPALLFFLNHLASRPHGDKKNMCRGGGNPDKYEMKESTCTAQPARHLGENAARLLFFTRICTSLALFLRSIDIKYEAKHWLNLCDAAK